MSSVKKSSQKTKFFQFPFFKILLLVSICVLGFFSWFLVFQKFFARDLSYFFPADTAIFLRFVPEHSNGIFQKIERSFSEKLPLKNLSVDFSKDIVPFLGGEFGLAFFDDGDFIFGLRYSSRRKAESFMNRFKLNDEKFHKTPFPEGDLFVPEYSSSLSFAFSKGYFFFSTSEEKLKELFSSSPRIFQDPSYQKIQFDFFADSFFSFFVRTGSAVHLLSKNNYEAIFPLLEMFGSKIPFLGGSFSFSGENVLFSGKVLSDESLFFRREIENLFIRNEMPRLSYFTPRDALFFFTGMDISQKYSDMNDFLAGLNPELPLVFQGALRSRMKEFFGEKFDFEKEFLPFISKDYAFALTQSLQEKSFVYTFMTRFKGSDEEFLAKIKEVLLDAQISFFPEVRSVELPDGTTREELVASPAPTPRIEERFYNGISYYYLPLLGNGKESRGLFFSVFNSVFIFSSQEEGVLNIFKAQQSQTDFAHDPDFHKNLFYFLPPAENYGYWNFSQKFSPSSFLTLFTTSSQDLGIQQKLSSNFFDDFLSNFESVTFSRRVYPHEIIWNAVFLLP